MTPELLREMCERALLLNRSLDMSSEQARIDLEIPGEAHRKVTSRRLAPGGPRGRIVGRGRATGGHPVLRVQFSVTEILSWLAKKGVRT